MKNLSAIRIKLSKPRNPVAVTLGNYKASYFKDKRAERGGAKKNDWKWNKDEWD